MEGVEEKLTSARGPRSTVRDPSRAPVSRSNRIIAARVVVAASRRSGQPVPEWVRLLATQLAGPAIRTSQANKIAAAKIVVEASSKTGQRVPAYIERLATRH